MPVDVFKITNNLLFVWCFFIEALSASDQTGVVCYSFLSHSIRVCHCLCFRSVCDRTVTVTASTGPLLLITERTPKNSFRKKEARQRGEWRA